MNWKKLGPAPAADVEEPLYDAEDLLGLAPADLKMPVDIREIIARIVDGSRFHEFKPAYGVNLVTGWASLYGYEIGILANQQGVLFSAEAQKAAQFIQLANRHDVPLVFIQNVTGYMVGKQYEQAGIIKHGAMMINAVSNSTVPHITLQIGGSYGAGNYGMCGYAYQPRFVFIWPNSKTAVMGPQQLAGVLSIVRRAAAQAAGKPFDEAQDADAAQGRRRPDRERVAGHVHQRPSIRRRHHRPPRHANRAGHGRFGRPLRRRPRGRNVRRVSHVNGD